MFRVGINTIRIKKINRFVRNNKDTNPHRSARAAAKIFPLADPPWFQPRVKKKQILSKRVTFEFSRLVNW